MEGGAERLRWNVVLPNIPTEEVFTTGNYLAKQCLTCVALIHAGQIVKNFVLHLLKTMRLLIG